MWAFWRQGYQRVDEHDQDEKSSRLTNGIYRNSGNLIAALTTYTLIALLAISGFVGLYLYYANAAAHHSSFGEHYLPCGNSSTEARSLGCRFDQLTWAWLPSYCPQYTNDRFINAEPEDPWRYYIDPYTKQLATADDMERSLNREVHLYGERREHLTHCVFMFLNVAQIFESGGRYSQAQVNHEHLEHCAELLLKALKMDDTRYIVETEVPYPKFDQDC